MNKLLILSILCVACAALKSLLAVLIVGLALTLIWGLISKPWQALGLLFSLAMTTLWTTYPLVCLISVVVLVIAVVAHLVVGRRRPGRSDQVAT